ESGCLPPDREREVGGLAHRVHAPRGKVPSRRCARHADAPPAGGDHPPGRTRYLPIRTSVTSLVKLFASTKLPSRVTSVLRTMLPPPGMVQVWNFSVFGSKRTTVFGLASDSLYQSTPLMSEMP